MCNSLGKTGDKRYRNLGNFQFKCSFKFRSKYVKDSLKFLFSPENADFIVKAQLRAYVACEKEKKCPKFNLNFAAIFFN